MNKGLIKLHDRLLSGKEKIKNVSDKDIDSLLKRALYDPVRCLSYPDSEVYFMAWDERRRREIDKAKKKTPLDESLERIKTQADVNKMHEAFKKKKTKIKKNFF